MNWLSPRSSTAIPRSSSRTPTAPAGATSSIRRSTGKDPAVLAKGLAGAFQPAWSPDAQWVAFGVGQWFQMRRTGKATVMRVRRDGTDLEALTDGSEHSGFPSYSADGKRLVYRVWGESVKGLAHPRPRHATDVGADQGI